MVKTLLVKSFMLLGKSAHPFGVSAKLLPLKVPVLEIRLDGHKSLELRRQSIINK